MLNGAEKEVIQRKYQQFRQANSFASADTHNYEEDK